MRRLALRVWANKGVVTDPDLDDGHPGGTGGPNKYIDGWVVEKEPHQWSNFLYQVQTENFLNHAQHGVFEFDSAVNYKIGALSWEADMFKVLTPTGWETAFASFTLDQAITIRDFGRDLLSVHAARKDNPHSNTAIQVGTVPVTGGDFTGEVFYSTLFTVRSMRFVNVSTIEDRWERTLVSRQGFVASDVPKFSDGATTTELYLQDSYLEHDLEVEQQFATPPADASWPFKRNPYSMTGRKDFIITGGNGLPTFNKLGLLLEAGKSYVLEDLDLVEYQGCMVATVDGVPVIRKTPAGSLDLAVIFGTGKAISNIHIWGYQLTDPQLNNKAARLA